MEIGVTIDLIDTEYRKVSLILLRDVSLTIEFPDNRTVLALDQAVIVAMPCERDLVNSMCRFSSSSTYKIINASRKDVLSHLKWILPCTQ